MEISPADVARELKVLRKGRGMHGHQIVRRVGPALKVICAVGDGDNSTEIRNKVTALLRKLADVLPNDLRCAVLAAFALDSDVRTQFYQDRVHWVARQLNRDERTARRRIDEGINQLAELAVAPSAVASPAAPKASGAGWHTAELRVALALDRPEAEAFELHRIVADRDELDELDLTLLLTSLTCYTDPAKSDEVHLDVFYGGRLLARTKDSTEGFVLALPKALRHAETYEFLLRFRAPRGRAILPHYVRVPRNRCDLFDLRIRFGSDDPPRRIWRLADKSQWDVDNPAPGTSEVVPNNVGEVHTTFHHLTPGLAYGLRWCTGSLTTGAIGQTDGE